MTDTAPSPPSRLAAARRPVRAPLAVTVGVTVMFAGCFRSFEDEEAAFYARASAIVPGASQAALERALGPPTRIARPELACREAGGRATWIYEYTPIEDDRLWLEEGPCVYCLDGDGRVVRREVRAAVAPDHAGLIVVR